MKRILLVFFVLFCVTCRAETINSFEPATFSNTGKYALQNRIKFPKADDNVSIVVFCDADVSKTGRLKETYCFSENKKETYAFEKAVLRAADGAKIKRAKVNEKGKPIWFQFSVEFSKKEEQKNISLYANHGRNTNRYGKNYISAQRYYESPRSFFIGCHRNTHIFIKAIIDENGMPSHVEAMGKGIEPCKNNIEKGFLKSRYIPAFSNEKPVASIYLESFFTSDIMEDR